jgi:hypothetical protein
MNYERSTDNRLLDLLSAGRLELAALLMKHPGQHFSSMQPIVKEFVNLVTALHFSSPHPTTTYRLAHNTINRLQIYY